MTVLLIPAPPLPDDPDLIRWRVGPGLVRFTGRVPPESLPAPVRRLVDDGIVESVSLQPGRIDTRLVAGHSRDAGVRVRSALYAVLSADAGWPDPVGSTPLPPTGRDDDRTIRARAADAEISTAVQTVLDGDFGRFTTSHGGHVELVGVHDGQVTVRLTGHCHGCAAADMTLQLNLAHRLKKVPGFATLRAIGDTGGR